MQTIFEACNSAFEAGLTPCACAPCGFPLPGPGPRIYNVLRRSHKRVRRRDHHSGRRHSILRQQRRRRRWVGARCAPFPPRAVLFSSLAMEVSFFLFLGHSSRLVFVGVRTCQVFFYFFVLFMLWEHFLLCLVFVWGTWEDDLGFWNIYCFI